VINFDLSVEFPMQLTDTHNKTCLIGLSYFDLQGEPLKQSQLAGKVIKSDAEEGISIELFTAGEQDAKKGAEKSAVFILPPTLNCWFVAPAGSYPVQSTKIENPDYLVTWDIHQTQKDTEEGQHEWWEWVPRTVPPQVGQ